MEFDERIFFSLKLGAITLLNNNIKDDDIVNVTALTYNIRKVYSTGNKLSNILQINKDKNENSKQEILENILAPKNNEQSTKLHNDMLNAEEIEITDNIQEYLNNYTENKDNAPYMTYNTELLKYLGVFEDNSEIIKFIIVPNVIIIFTIIIISIFLLSNSFKITYAERAKEYAMLATIGMDKNERNSMIKKENIILGLIRHSNWINIRIINNKNFNKYN